MLYTPEQKEFIRDFCEQREGTWEVTCKKLKLVFQKKFHDILNVQSGSSLQKIYSRLKVVSEDMKDDIKAVIQQDIQRTKAKKENVEDRAKNKQLIIEITRLQEEKDILLDIKSSNYERQEIQPNPIKKSEAVAVIVGSDWHIDENIDPRTISQMNEYNPKIAQERIQNFFRNGLKLTDIMAKEISIEKIMLAML